MPKSVAATKCNSFLAGRRGRRPLQEVVFSIRHRRSKEVFCLWAARGTKPKTRRGRVFARGVTKIGRGRTELCSYAPRPYFRKGKSAPTRERRCPLDNDVSEKKKPRWSLLNESRTFYFITAEPCISSATCCGISSMQSIVYHQAAGKCTLARDEIQPKGLMISTTLRAVMICQVCDLDKKQMQNVSHSAFVFGGDVGS